MNLRDKTLHALTRSDAVRSTYGALRKIPGLGAGFEKIVRSAIPPGARLWIEIPAGMAKGLWMNTDPRFDLGYANGDYEPWIQELLKSELRPGDCYFDVGSHTGFFAMIAARMVGLNGRVIAFEPDNANAGILKANVAKNRLGQITLIRAAVCASSGQASFSPAHNASNRSQGHLSQKSAVLEASITVPAVRLDEIVFEQGHPPPQLMKLDIEGAEWDALQGAERLLNEKKPKLLCEIHDSREMGKIRDYLQQCGYATEEWKPVHEHYADYRQLYLWAVPSQQRIPAETASLAPSAVR